MSKREIAGWIITLTGSAIWTYGYFAIGHTSFIDWRNETAWWICQFLPNRESEIGMLLTVVGMVPIYWPKER
jgi:hypothetical protein